MLSIVLSYKLKHLFIKRRVIFFKEPRKLLEEESELIICLCPNRQNMCKLFPLSERFSLGMWTLCTEPVKGVQNLEA